MMKLKYVIGGL